MFFLIATLTTVLSFFVNKVCFFLSWANSNLEGTGVRRFDLQD